MFALVPTGIYFTVRSGFAQLFHVRHAFDIVLGRFDDPDDDGDISHFQALCAALSATVGTGNIAGVALAIAWGGPGAIFWMWLTGFIGMATKFAECTLAQHFRVIHEDGSTSGGPMYYIRDGLKDLLGGFAGVLATIFAIATVACSFGTGNMAQSNSIVNGLSEVFCKISSWSSGTIVKAAPTWVPYSLALMNAVLVGLVIIGGIKRIGQVAERLVPFMGVFYVISAIAVILGVVAKPVALIIVVGVFLSWFWPSRYRTGRGRRFALASGMWILAALLVSAYLGCPLFRSLKLIIVSAFTGHAALGGFAGSTLILAARWGLARGLFSNEAGQGSAPIAHAAAKTKYPIREGFVAMLEPLVDTLIICTMTALVIIFTDTWSSGQRGVALTAASFQNGLGGIHPFLAHVGFFMVTVGLFLFALSTAISWSYYGERAVLFLAGPKAITPYRFAYCTFVFLGGVFSLELVWSICDALITMMALPNLIAILLLSPLLFKMLDDYDEPPQHGIAGEAKPHAAEKAAAEEIINWEHAGGWALVLMGVIQVIVLGNRAMNGNIGNYIKTTDGIFAILSTIIAFIIGVYLIRLVHLGRDYGDADSDEDGADGGEG